MYFISPLHQPLPQPPQEEDWDSFRKKWFEVAIMHPLDFLSQSGGTESVSTSTHTSSFQSSPQYMYYEEQVKVCKKSIYMYNVYMWRSI